MDVKKYIIRNRKRSLFTVLSLTFSSILLFTTSILISSFRDNLIKNVEREIGRYHVIIKGDIKKDKYILNMKYKDDRYFVTYKDIYKTYENTERICKGGCDGITYNDELLSLYGISKNKNVMKMFKNIIIFFTSVFGVIIFFIIYSLFKISVRSRKEDLCRLKLLGYTNFDLFKLFIKESLILGTVGIFIGFIISLCLNGVLISIINNLLSEIFISKLNISIYIPFLLIPLIYMIIIVLLSTFLTFKNVKTYSPIELFKSINDVDKVDVKLKDNIILWLSLVNYKRSKEKYKSLIICIFIATVSVNVFFLVLNYGLKAVDKYVIIPKYDLYVRVEDYDLNKISSDLNSKKSLIFKSCTGKAKIPKEKFIKGYKNNIDVLITNLKGNEIVNRVDIVESKKRFKREKYSRFKDLNEVLFISDDEYKIDGLSLTKKVPFGLENEESVIINLDEDFFNSVCSSYTNNLIITTDYKNIDGYLNNIIKKDGVPLSYLNVKKMKQITENVILVIKLFLYFIVVLIVLVMVCLTLNITSISMHYRKREFKLLNSLGFEKRKINLSLIIESLIICFKGWIYALPFILIIDKFIYKTLIKVFYLKNMIIDYKILILSLFISLMVIYISIYKNNDC
ncbi:MAG: ABC transporter permease [Bacilli bacterium]|nr:ABC transporter permease [Bacilli bacterium]